MDKHFVTVLMNLNAILLFISIKSVLIPLAVGQIPNDNCVAFD